MKRTGDLFIEEVKQREEIVTLKSGLLMEIIEYNRDEKAKSPAGDHSEILFSFTGSLKNNVKFNQASSESYLPYMKTKAWKEALQYMVEGDRFKFYVPYELGYGLKGSPPKIPKASPIIFDIELISVTSGAKSASKARKQLEDNTVVVQNKVERSNEDAEL